MGESKKKCSKALAHLPHILLQESMDDNPGHAVEQHIHKVQRSMVIVDLREGLVVNTSTLGLCGKEEERDMEEGGEKRRRSGGRERRGRGREKRKEGGGNREVREKRKTQEKGYCMCHDHKGS